jgi:hypothetical protein
MLKRITPADRAWYDISLHYKALLNQHILDLQQLKLPTWTEIRRTRDTLLKVSDWTQAPDSPLSPEKKQEWAAYRQALRDLPESGDVNNIAWPQQPQ